MSNDGNALERTKVRDALTHGIIGCAITVHKEMGPGLPEGVYEECMGREMSRRGVEFTRQTVMTLTYDGRPVGRSFRPDFIVNGSVVVELKSVDVVHPRHVSQVLSYMRVSKVELGLIINFNVEVLIHGVKRLILTKSG